MLLIPGSGNQAETCSQSVIEKNQMAKTLDREQCFCQIPTLPNQWYLLTWGRESEQMCGLGDEAVRDRLRLLGGNSQKLQTSICRE